MTYSIVARDESTGELGVAVQTCNLAVGTWVPWAKGGVGAVATQSHADRTYGTLGLELMSAGKSARQALDALLAADPRCEFRQVAMVDNKGTTAVHTGLRCLPDAGHRTGEGFCTQANMMASPAVWPAMAAAYELASDDLAARLLAALDAAEHEGGDIRGRQSAALLVVAEQPSPFPLIDLRVDHHPEPLRELRKMLRLHWAYMAEYDVTRQVAAGDLVKATILLDEIAESAPDEEYLQFLRAYHYTKIGRFDEGVALMRNLVTTNAIWVEYLKRDSRSDTFDSPGVAEQMLQSLGIAPESTSRQPLEN